MRAGFCGVEDEMGRANYQIVRNIRVDFDPGPAALDFNVYRVRERYGLKYRAQFVEAVWPLIENPQVEIDFSERADAHGFLVVHKRMSVVGSQLFPAVEKVEFEDESEASHFTAKFLD